MNGGTNSNEEESAMKTYYAVCNANGPISVELDAESLGQALAAWNDLDARAAIDNASTDAEDALDINGEGMSDEEFDAALEAAGARLVRPLGEIDQQGRSVLGDWNLWVHDDEDDDDVVEATASNPRPSTEVDGGMDVDVVVTIGGRNHQGEVTLLSGRAWGDSPAAWVSGELLQELYKLPDAAFRSALSVIETAAADVATSYDPPTYTYTIFDADPDSSSGTQWTSHADVELEADSDEEAVAAVRDVLEIEAAGLSELDEYEVGQRIYALIWTPDGTVEKLSHELTASDLGVPDTRAVTEALEDAGYSASEYSGGGLYVSVENGTQGDGSDVDGTPKLEEIRSIVAPFGMSAEWSGDSNTASDGDTTSDVVIR